MLLPRAFRLASFGLPLALFACDGGGDITSSTGGGGSGGNGGSTGGQGGASTGGSATTSTGPTGGGGGGGAGGSGPTGTPMAYVGTQDGKIRVLSLDKASGALSPVQEVDAGTNPSFLAFAPDGKYLYSVDEGQDALGSFAIDGATGQLTPLNSAPCGGNGPAHVAVDATGNHVFGVNYGSGDVRRINVTVDGSFGAGVTDLSTGANAHQIVLDASNQFAFVPNKGTDTVSQLVFDAATGQLDFNQPPSVSLPAGSGPRHLAFHPSAPFAYVIHEIDDKVTAFPFDARKGTLGAPIQTISTLPAGVDGGSNTCAEIAFGVSGKHLYGSNRGHDSIVIYDVNTNSGMMTLVGHQPTGGAVPRHFSVEPSGEILLVGNQGSDDVRTFRIDPQAGTLTELSTLPLPAGPSFVGVLYL
jgi:6-phosphogluconolactonase